VSSTPKLSCNSSEWCRRTALSGEAHADTVYEKNGQTPSKSSRKLDIREPVGVVPPIIATEDYYAWRHRDYLSNPIGCERSLTWNGLIYMHKIAKLSLCFTLFILARVLEVSPRSFWRQSRSYGPVDVDLNSKGVSRMIIGLDHVNIRTTELGAMIRFYTEVLGLRSAERPQSKAAGAWLYSDGKPLLHLVQVVDKPSDERPKVEHFAFQGSDFAFFIKNLHGSGVAFRLSINRPLQSVSVNIHDPDGNRFHVDFPLTELIALADDANSPFATEARGWLSAT
jgi:catechol 2,3-dioxygenase-like lactoylglutathione lyase family enzyme